VLSERVKSDLSAYLNKNRKRRDFEIKDNDVMGL
jgi:hypothetical protein